MDDVFKGYVSLFSGGGFGDVGIHFGAKLPIIACCELLPDRAAVLKTLFPQAAHLVGDIRALRREVVDAVQRRTGGQRPFLLVMSPPCQGMSSNGAGRIGSAVKSGKRDRVDPRNSLIIPGLEVAEMLQPEWVVVENVKHMLKTSVANEFGEPENIVHMIGRRLPNYGVAARVLDAASFGVPQRRERLITICGRNRPHVDAFHPRANLECRVSLERATQHLPPLDSQLNLRDEADSVHHVPRWNDMQYFCMRHTPQGRSAFSNARCVDCGTDAEHEAVDCAQCGRELPRPIRAVRGWSCSGCGEFADVRRVACSCCGYVRASEPEVSKRRLIRAFKTSYCRMRAGEPASTLTTNSGVISSDVKGHPTQNRVLSVREVLIVASMAPYPGFDPPWADACRQVEALPGRVVREISGESIPPLLAQRIVERILHVSDGASEAARASSR